MPLLEWQWRLARPSWCPLHLCLTGVFTLQRQNAWYSIEQKQVAVDTFVLRQSTRLGKKTSTLRWFCKRSLCIAPRVRQTEESYSSVFEVRVNDDQVGLNMTKVLQILSDFFLVLKVILFRLYRWKIKGLFVYINLSYFSTA